MWGEGGKRSVPEHSEHERICGMDVLNPEEGKAGPCSFSNSPLSDWHLAGRNPEEVGAGDSQLLRLGATLHRAITMLPKGLSL